MKKVCHITSVHPRFDIRIFHKECISLQKAGYEVTLLVCDSLKNEKVEGIELLSTGFVSRSRMDRLLNSRKRIYKAALEVNAEIYHLHDPELLPICKKLKRQGKKVIFDSHEDIPADIMDKPWIPVILRKPVSAVYQLYEKSVLKQLDALISVTPVLTERLEKINNNTVEITNYPVLSRLKERSIGNNRTICFAGNIKREYNHHIILEVLEQLEGVTYLLAGRCNSGYIEELKRMPGWSKVEYLGEVSHEEVADIYCKSNIGISLHQYLPNVGGKKGSLGIIKNFEFMMSGLPIIVTDFQVWKQIVDSERCGICVTPDDKEAIRDAIEYILRHTEIAEEMGRNGRTAIEKKYNWGTQEAKLLNLYETI